MPDTPPALTDSAAETSADPGSATRTLDLTDLINNHLTQIDRLKEQQSKLKEMLDAIFQNDPTYQIHDAAVKEAQKVKSATKKQILKLPQAADLQNQIQELKTHTKDLNDTLSEYIQDYARTTGQTTIETSDGQVRQIVYVAKLVRTSSKPAF